MTAIVNVLQAIVRDELTGVRPLTLGVVTAVTTNEAGDGKHNLEVNVRVAGSDLELQRVPVLVGRIGVSSVPRVADLVVLGFLEGDVNGAVVLGVLHDDAQHPPKAAPDEVVYQVPDAGGDRRAEIVLPNGNTVTVTDGAVTVAMGGTSLTVESGGKVVIDAAGDIELTSKGNIKLSAQGNLDLSALGNAKLDATGSTEVSSAASTTVKGATTKVTGVISFSAS